MESAPFWGMPYFNPNSTVNLLGWYIRTRKPVWSWFAILMCEAYTNPQIAGIDKTFHLQDVAELHLPIIPDGFPCRLDLKGVAVQHLKEYSFSTTAVIPSKLSLTIPTHLVKTS